MGELPSRSADKSNQAFVMSSQERNLFDYLCLLPNQDRDVPNVMPADDLVIPASEESEEEIDIMNHRRWPGLKLVEERGRPELVSGSKSWEEIEEEEEIVIPEPDVCQGGLIPGRLVYFDAEGHVIPAEQLNKDAAVEVIELSSGLPIRCGYPTGSSSPTFHAQLASEVSPSRPESLFRSQHSQDGPRSHRRHSQHTKELSPKRSQKSHSQHFQDDSLARSVSRHSLLSEEGSQGKHCSQHSREGSQGKHCSQHSREGSQGNLCSQHSREESQGKHCSQHFREGSQGKHCSQHSREGSPAKSQGCVSEPSSSSSSRSSSRSSRVSSKLRFTLARWPCDFYPQLCGPRSPSCSEHSQGDSSRSLSKSAQSFFLECPYPPFRSPPPRSLMRSPGVDAEVSMTVTTFSSGTSLTPHPCQTVDEDLSLDGIDAAELPVDDAPADDVVGLSPPCCVVRGTFTSMSTDHDYVMLADCDDAAGGEVEVEMISDDSDDTMTPDSLELGAVAVSRTRGLADDARRVVGATSAASVQDAQLFDQVDDTKMMNMELSSHPVTLTPKRVGVLDADGEFVGAPDDPQRQDTLEMKDPLEQDKQMQDTVDVDPPEKDPPEKDPPEKDPLEQDKQMQDTVDVDPPEKDPSEKDPPEKDPPEKDPPEKDPPEKDPQEQDKQMQDTLDDIQHELESLSFEGQPPSDSILLCHQRGQYGSLKSEAPQGNGGSPAATQSVQSQDNSPALPLRPISGDTCEGTVVSLAMDVPHCSDLESVHLCDDDDDEIVLQSTSFDLFDCIEEDDRQLSPMLASQTVQHNSLERTEDFDHLPGGFDSFENVRRDPVMTESIDFKSSSGKLSYLTNSTIQDNVEELNQTNYSYNFLDEENSLSGQVEKNPENQSENIIGGDDGFCVQNTTPDWIVDIEAEAFGRFTFYKDHVDKSPPAVLLEDDGQLDQRKVSGLISDVDKSPPPVLSEDDEQLDQEKASGLVSDEQPGFTKSSGQCLITQSSDDSFSSSSPQRDLDALSLTQCVSLKRRVPFKKQMQPNTKRTRKSWEQWYEQFKTIVTTGRQKLRAQNASTSSLSKSSLKANKENFLSSDLHFPSKFARNSEELPKTSTQSVGCNESELKDSVENFDECCDSLPETSNASLWPSKEVNDQQLVPQTAVVKMNLGSSLEHCSDFKWATVCPSQQNGDEFNSATQEDSVQHSFCSISGSSKTQSRLRSVVRVGLSKRNRPKPLHCRKWWVLTTIIFGMCALFSKFYRVSKVH